MKENVETLTAIQLRAVLTAERTAHADTREELRDTKDTIKTVREELNGICAEHQLQNPCDPDYVRCLDHYDNPSHVCKSGFVGYCYDRDGNMLDDDDLI